MLDADKLLPGRIQRAEQFVQLRLHGRSVPVLAILDQENHQKGDDGGRGVHDQLPSVGIAKDRPRHLSE